MVYGIWWYRVMTALMDDVECLHDYDMAMQAHVIMWHHHWQNGY